jgi:rSAM/selenodomain-associated transferase 1
MNPTRATANHDAVLVVLCRRPRPGVGKQRLAAAVGRDAALAIASALLDCTLEDLAGWPGPIVLSPSEAQDADWARSLLGARAQVLAQPAGNLGERLEAVDRELRRRGHARLLYIGTDAPALPAGLFAAAAAALDDVDVVLAPARDGGVTLMGARRAWPPLAALPWSTAALGAALEAACRARGDSLGRLATSNDVDEAADLDWVCAALAADPRAARRELCRLARLARVGEPPGDAALPGAAAAPGAPAVPAAPAVRA